MFFDNIHTRIRFFFLLIFCLLFIIICRVFYIQVFSYDKLSSLAEGLWSRKLPIGADRGEIYDRKGRVLATNLTTTSLVLIPNQIKNPEEVAKKLSEILNSDYNAVHYQKYFNENREKFKLMEFKLGGGKKALVSI